MKKKTLIIRLIICVSMAAMAMYLGAFAFAREVYLFAGAMGIVTLAFCYVLAMLLNQAGITRSYTCNVNENNN